MPVKAKPPAAETDYGQDNPPPATDWFVPPLDISQVKPCQPSTPSSSSE